MKAVLAVPALVVLLVAVLSLFQLNPATWLLLVIALIFACRRSKPVPDKRDLILARAVLQRSYLQGRMSREAYMKADGFLLDRIGKEVCYG